MKEREQGRKKGERFLGVWRSIKKNESHTSCKYIFFSITRLYAISHCFIFRKLCLISNFVIELLNLLVSIQSVISTPLIQLYICKWDLYLLYCLRLTFKCSHSFYYNFVSKTSIPYVSKGKLQTLKLYSDLWLKFYLLSIPQK